MADSDEPRGAVILPFRRRSADELPARPAPRVDPIERRYARAMADAKRERDAIRASMGDIQDVSLAIDKVEANRTPEHAPLLAGLYVFRALLRDIDQDAPGALADVARAVELTPDDVDLLRRAARIRARRGDPGGIALLDHAAELAPADPVTYQERGELLAEISDHERALTNFNRVLTLDPHSKAAHQARMTSLRALGRLDEAIEAAAAALRLDPNDAELRHTRGGYIEEKGDLEGAAREYDRAIKLRPNEPYWISERGFTHFRLGNLPQALADYARALQLEPEEPYFFGARAAIHWKLGDNDKALADLAAAIRLDPDHGRYLWQRGNIHISRQDFASAVADCRAAVDKEPDDLHFRADLARCLYLASRWAEAIEAVEVALARAPRDVDMLLLRAEIHKRSGDAEASLQALFDAVEAEPASATIQLALARRLFERSEYPDAADAADAALGIDPKLVDALLIRGTSRCYMELDDPATELGGQADLDLAKTLAPNNAMVFLHRGGVLFRRDRLEDALVELERAVECAPDHADMYFARGRVLVDLAKVDGRLVDRAISDLTEAAKRKPKFPMTYILRGMAHQIFCREAEAVLDYSRAIEVAPNEAEAFYRRAGAYSELGEAEKSQADLEKAASLGHEDAKEMLTEEPDLRWWG